MSSEAKNAARLLNPWVFHLQKLGLELKCPLCMNLLNNPVLLPCNHIFCKLCIPESNQFKANCAVCQHGFADQEIRPASYMENIVATYKSLSATFNSTILPLLSADSGDLDVSISTSVEQLGKKLSEIAPKEENKQTNASLMKCTESGMELSKKAVKGEVIEVLEVNQAPELSPDSSPSIGDAKDAGHNNDLGSRNGSTGKNTAKRFSREKLGTTADGVDHKTFHAGTFNARESKRQKKLSYEQSEAITPSHGHNQHIISQSDPAMVPNCDKEHKFLEDTSVNFSKALGDASYMSGSFCAFCNSSKITQETGPMLHYADGNEVAKDDIAFPKAIPVHKKCIDWTPQVYYVGETIKNLDSELARASKLKCTSCGLKGAALGCFAKSCRRSYHVPCALKIPNCRWDCDDFVMLCPVHKSTKFPRERSNSRKCDSQEKHSLSTQRTSDQLSFWANSPIEPQEWVFCGSSLSSDEKILLLKFASACGATVLKFWSPKVTHVIAATDTNGSCSRTLKVLMAILNGRWVLPMDWVKVCMEENRPEPEEPYEVNLDNHGCRDGPKLGRLRVSNNTPKLFDGLSFYFGGEFVPAYKNDLLDLVIVGGGTIIENLEQAVTQRHNIQSISTNIVVYNRDNPRESTAIEASSSILKRLTEAKDVAKCIDAQVVPHTWILESIAACRMLPYPYC
ncbi:hypothetical protein ACJIZ3_011878 [Penstemon smallii]|uniref:Uncharacterized protein n=1 Tax=Penstemon smallii TaxID=265156 RepID=A0ABD3UKD4_9LAMI